MTPAPLFILGMHRSGTSCLTGMLEEAGLWLGDVKRASTHNRKGNRENPRIMQLNEAVLAANGGAWDNPPSAQVQWDAAQMSERAEILSTYPKGRMWGFKDPRTLFTLEGWRRALPQARLVGSFRHPVAVARSLEARSKMPLDRGLALWTSYNHRLLDLAQSEDVPLICFDMPPAAYLAKVDALISDLGLRPPAQGSSFFEADLRHQSATDTAALPRETQALYDVLCDRLI